MMDWEKYDLETEQKLEELRNSLPWDTIEQGGESAAQVGALHFRRLVDKEVLENIAALAEKNKQKEK